MFGVLCLFVAVITPPVTKRHIAFDIDATLTEAAQFLAQKANNKRAPLPPKRTSSFRDPSAPMPQPRSTSSHLSPAADDAAAGIMVTSMTDSIDLSIATGADSLSDHQNRSIQSSSDDLLSSTPASQSRNGSLERILEHSGSGPAADLQSAGCSSGDQKTPDTDASDASLPPPPPSLLVDINSGVNTLPRFTRVTSHHQHGGVIADQNVLNQLRQSLKKTTSRPRKAAPTSSGEIVDDNFDSGHSSPKAGFYSDQAPRAVVSGYSTVPRSSGTASASFLNSLERSTKSTHTHTDVYTESADTAKLEVSGPVSDVLHMPTPEVRRKVEEWQAGVERSLRASDDRGWKLKPGKWNKRASCQEADLLSAERATGDSSLQDRLSSDSSTLHEQSGEEHNVKPSAILRVSAPNTFVTAEPSAPDVSSTSKPEKVRWKLSKTKADDTNSKNPSADPKPLDRHVSDSMVQKSEVLSGTKKNKDSSEESRKVGAVALREGDSKSAGKSRKVNAVQSMFLSSDSPFHGAHVSVGKSDSGKKQESASGDISPGAKVRNKPAKGEAIKPNLPPGAKPVLPAFKPQLQSQTQQLISSPQQLVAQSSVLQRSGSAAAPADKEATGDDLDCTKENVLSLAHSLSNRLSELIPKSTPSTSLQSLTDDVQLFHRICSGYVESLPPHAKFQFREILATLEKVADGLRASGGRDHDRLLVTLQNSVRSIEEAALKK